MVIVHVVERVMYGGVGAVVRSLALEQSNEGHDVVVVTRKSEETEFSEWCQKLNVNIKVHFIENYRERRLTLWGCLSNQQIKKIQEEYNDKKIIFHFHNTIACGLISTIPKNSVCTIHGFIGKINNSKVSNLIADMTIKKMLKNNVKMVGCCKSVADYCNVRYKTHNFKYVLNGLSYIEINKNNLYVKEGKINIGFSAYIDELKGWRFLADAYTHMAKEAKEKCCLYFAGEIDKKDEQDFKNFIDKENAVYLGYIQDAGKNFIPFLDILVLPSRTEGLPISILEAMQQGVIPVATNVGGISEVIDNQKTGFLIFREVDYLKNILENLIKNTELRNIVKYNAKITYQEKYTARLMSKNYQKIYE